jgi:hypothetical protein
MTYCVSKNLSHLALRGNGLQCQTASRRVLSRVEFMDSAICGVAWHALMNAGELMT